MPSMSKIFSAGAAVAALLSTVSAHTMVEEWQVGGVTYPGYYQAPNENATPNDPGNQSPAWWTNQGWGYQPIKGDQIANPDIIAHKDAKPSPYTAPVDAGSDVTFSWHHTGSCSDGDENGWDCSHHGWTATYLAACPGDCKDVVKTDLSFFKIHQAALIDYRPGRYSAQEPSEQVGYWGTDAIFYDNGNKQTVTIPKDIPSGNYVLRTEVASIHNNGAVKNRQLWPQAFNIKVNGGSGTQVPAGVKGTEIYHSDDALMTWDLYQHTAEKTIAAAPGPKLAAVANVSSKSRRHARDFA